MLTSTKSLLPYLLLLLLPTGVVGWIGLSQMGRLDRDLSDLRAESTALLQDRRDGCQLVLSRLIDEHVGQLNDQSRNAMKQRLHALNFSSKHPAVRLAFLMPANTRTYRPYLPRLPRLGLGSYRMYHDAEQRKDKTQTAARIIEAELIYRMTGSLEDRLQHLDFGTNQARAIGTEFEVALHSLELGTTLKKQGKFKQALDALTAARSSMTTQARASGPLYLSLVLTEAESELALLESNDGSEPRNALPGLAIQTLDQIANGDFDNENDEFLGMVYDKLERIAERSSGNSDEVAARLSQLTDINNRRVALRVELESLMDEIVLPLQRLRKAGETSFAIPVGIGREQSLVCVTTVTDDKDTPYCLGLLVDLSSLYAEFIVDLEEFLATTNQWFRIQFVDDQDNVLIGDEVPPEDVEASKALTSSVQLQGLLKDFRLTAVPRDPHAMYSAKRKGRLMRMALLIGLALVAGAGAFLLTRTVRKETEIAGLKTSFVARVSHELKTPLALIRMYGETLAMGRVEDPEKSVEFAAIIAKEADRLTRMIDNVLDFSQIEAGTKRYEKVPTRLDVHLDSVLRSYAPHLEERGFALTWGRMPPLVAMVDPEGLTQALVNLLSNAAKYSDPGAEDHSIEVRLCEDDGRARISVRDRGIGVPEGERGRVFETFYRASTAGERRGVGLGLALVKYFAEAHSIETGRRASPLDDRRQGAVLCEPRDGGGTVFSILLPIESATGTQDGDENQ